MNERRIVLFGKTGVGKSSFGNTLLNENVFATGNSPNSITQRSETNTRSINGRDVIVVDNPGFFDTVLTQEQLKSEILRCMTECAPGPHAFVIMLRVDRYTEQEKEVVKKITASFGEEALKYAVVLLTHGDDLSEGQTIEQFVEQSTELQELVEKCGDRVHVLDNKYWKQQQDGYRSNRVQVEKLLNTIEKMIRDSVPPYYSNEVLQSMKRAVEVQMENMRREGNDEDINIMRARAAQTVHERLMENLPPLLLGLGAGALLAVFLGPAAGTAGAVSAEQLQFISIALVQTVARVFSLNY